VPDAFRVQFVLRGVFVRGHVKALIERLWVLDSHCRLHVGAGRVGAHDLGWPRALAAAAAASGAIGGEYDTQYGVGDDSLQGRPQRRGVRHKCERYHKQGTVVNSPETQKVVLLQVVLV
jgi:hypothetical protein